MFSFLPPSTTIRCYQRATLATTAAELGAVYCAVVSAAHAPRAQDALEVGTSLSAVRSKLTRSIFLRTNVVYEVPPPARPRVRSSC